MSGKDTHEPPYEDVMVALFGKNPPDKRSDVENFYRFVLRVDYGLRRFFRSTHSLLKK